MAEKHKTDLGFNDHREWDYTYIPEPLLSEELRSASSAHTELGTDVVTFQPSRNPVHRMQDRYVIAELPMPNGKWKFRAVLDGHAGHETVDWVKLHLPEIVETNLRAHFSIYATHSGSLPPAIVSNVLRNSIERLDEKLMSKVLTLFPDAARLSTMPDEQISQWINDKREGWDGEKPFDAVARCLRGSTVLVALTDPDESNLWVASLGDCRAVLGFKQLWGWEVMLLSGYHNASDPFEEERIRNEHPNEHECIVDERILGALAVTRAIGDCMFKLPLVYTNKVFKNHEVGYSAAVGLGEYLARNHTPPYVSNYAEVQHIDLRSTLLKDCPKYLVMCTDGLADLYEDLGIELDQMGKTWVDVLGGIIGSSYIRNEPNLALKLLRYGLGDDDLEKVCPLMTVEADFRWMDDVTILASRLE
ncbi:hypothetical protein AX16_006969 [Volvariella volvacea WC 439]|nr:hypothetical protein AX16_006969 [Volvariella volvacea WC 439]